MEFADAVRLLCDRRFTGDMRRCMQPTAEGRCREVASILHQRARRWSDGTADIMSTVRQFEQTKLSLHVAIG